MLLKLRLSCAAILFLIFLQCCTSDPSLPEIQEISDFLSDSTGQLKNNKTSKVSPEKDAINKQKSSTTAPDILDSDWMNAWRQRLAVYAEWLDNFAEAYPITTPKTFARKSRGRLDRMPLTYGKRSIRMVDNSYEENDDNLDGITRAKQNSENQDSAGKIETSVESNTADLEEPSSSANDDKLIKLFTEHTKTGSDEAVDTEDLFSRITRNIMGRLPAMFGGLQDEEMLGSSIGSGYFLRTQKSRVDRMPAMFGKRQDGEMPDTFKDIDFSRSARGRVDRMPSMFGKREDGEMQETSDDGDYFSRMPKSRVNRMPAMFGKRSSDDGNLESLEDGSYFLRLPKSRVSRMPAMFGKRQDDDMLDTPQEGIDFSRVSRGNVNRMPVMFGKRQDGEMPDDVNQNSLFSRSAKARVDRMPAMFGKRGVGEMHDTSEKGDFFSRTTKGLIDRMPAMFGKRQDEISPNSEEGSYFSRTQKGSLNRMPAMFGKRGEDKTPRSLSFKSQGAPFVRISKGSLGRMPLTYGKRSTESYDKILHTLRSKLNTLPPERRDQLIKRLDEFLDNVMIEHTPLSRFHRSRLDRMPLTFGKRSTVEFPRTPLNPSGEPGKVVEPGRWSIQKRSRLSQMPVRFGKRSAAPGWDKVKRLRLTRMPIPFGKRLAEGERLHVDVTPKEEDSSNVLSPSNTNSDSDSSGNSLESINEDASDIISTSFLR